MVVIKRKFCDFFAIAIPLEITLFSIMMVFFDISSGFESSSFYENGKGYMIAEWFACSLYGGFHLLYAIHYLQSSVTLKITQQYAMLLKASQDE